MTTEAITKPGWEASGPASLGDNLMKYIYRWNRQGRKGQPCNVLVRGSMNSCLVEFQDGFKMVTSRNAIKLNRKN